MVTLTGRRPSDALSPASVWTGILIWGQLRGDTIAQQIKGIFMRTKGRATTAGGPAPVPRRLRALPLRTALVHAEQLVLHLSTTSSVEGRTGLEQLVRIDR